MRKSKRDFSFDDNIQFNPLDPSIYLEKGKIMQRNIKSVIHSDGAARSFSFELISARYDGALRRNRVK